MRSLVMIVCVFCVATLMTEALGLAYLWYRGQLTPAALTEISAMLRGEERFEDEDAAEDEGPAASSEEIELDRTYGILLSDARRLELKLLNDTLNETTSSITQEHALFDTEKAAFVKKLEEQGAAVASASTEQGRNILLAMEPAEAVKNLMQLDVDENVALVKGMPEKKIAAILEEFGKGGPKEIERGQRIFEAISQGKPTTDLISQKIEALEPEAETPMP